MSDLRRREGVIGGFRPGPGGEFPRSDIDEALDDLDRITRSFGGELTQPDEPEPLAGADRSGPIPIDRGAESDTEPFEARMAEAEQEARRYLERAKRRAETLVETMVGAVEREAERIRDRTEQGIRERWERVENEVSRHVDEAERVAEGMVGERHHQLAELSDEILRRGRGLSAGMADADRVREQFDTFIRALSETASEVAEAHGYGPATAEESTIDRIGARRERAAARPHDHAA